MIKVRRNPTRSGMTGHAVLCGRDVIPRLANSRCAVMAAAAGTDHIGMINSQYGHPSGIAVTILTHIVG